MKVQQFRISFNPSGKIYGFTGKVAQGAFLGLLKNENDMTADVLHFGNRRRPYSVTPIRVGTPSYFDVTSLNDELSTHLTNILGNYQQRVITISDRVEQLLAPEIKTVFLTPTPIAEGTSIHLDFRTPTLFSSVHRKARMDAYPHIHRIWGDLVKTWNSFAESKVDESIVDRLLNQLSTPFFEFKSVPIKMGKMKVVGFTGKISFTVEDSTGLNYLIPLTRLARYFGVGGKRAMGFGNVNIRMGVRKNRQKKDAA